MKDTGDGLMVAFGSASAAVMCAVAMQELFERRYRDTEQGLLVRIGLCDNVTFAPLSAIWVRDFDSGRLAAFEQPIECKFGGGVAETKGRMTGGAKLLATTPNGAQPQIAVTLHCNKAVNPNQMEVGWKDPSTGKEHRFHMTQMTSATCSDDPTITPNPPKANFDTHEGTGTGRVDGAAGANAEWKLQDAGEPGTGKDRGRITIKDANEVVLEAPLGPTLDGNWQAHNTK